MGLKDDSVVLGELRDELAGLVSKHLKLGMFMRDKSFEGIPTKQKDGMEKQYHAMGLYISALSSRIFDLEERVEERVEE